jgi:hypothetical protein
VGVRRRQMPCARAAIPKPLLTLYSLERGKKASNTKLLFYPMFSVIRKDIALFEGYQPSSHCHSDKSKLR